MANLRIKLVKSLNGRLDKHIATANSMGLHKIGNETVQPDNPQTRGKIAKIGYLLQVTEEARSGGGVRIGFEGGQMPLARRIPKRGFNNIFAKPFESINVSALDKFSDGDVVDAKALLDAGILSSCRYGVKILGNGEISKKLTVKASAFSETAKEKIEAAGGKAEVI